MDKLNVHKSPRAADTLAVRGAWRLLLPKYAPDLNPLEMAFAKLKSLLRKAKARNSNDLWHALGDIFAMFEPDECWNHRKAAGCFVD